MRIITNDPDRQGAIVRAAVRQGLDIMSPLGSPDLFVTEPAWVAAARRAHAYAEADHGESCRHGHSFCSVTPGGACMDEVLSRHEAEAPFCSDCEGSDG